VSTYVMITRFDYSRMRISAYANIYIIYITYHGTFVTYYWCHTFDQNGSTALMYAAEEDHRDTMNMLFENNATINLQNKVRIATEFSNIYLYFQYMIIQ